MCSARLVGLPPKHALACKDLEGFAPQTGDQGKHLGWHKKTPPTPSKIEGAPSPVGRNKRVVCFNAKRVWVLRGCQRLSVPYAPFGPLSLQDIDNRHISPISLQHQRAKIKRVAFATLQSLIDVIFLCLRNRSKPCVNFYQ